jgi:hypothetical protein
MNVQRLALVCGIVSAVLYIAGDVTAATFFYPGYDYTSQQVSELSAIGAPSRPFWMVMTYPYNLLTIAFAAGVWAAAAGAVRLRVTAVLILLFALNSQVWAMFVPMHMRGTTFTETDTMHIAFAVSAIVLMVLFIVFGASALGRGFRVYSALTVVAMLAAGAVVSTQVDAIAAGQPTPWMGLVERISVYGPIVWIAVFAACLLRRDSTPRVAPLAKRASAV